MTLDHLGLGEGTWNFNACAERIRQATTSVIEAEDAYKKAIERSADAEAVYRHQLAVKFKEYRDNKQPVEAATTLARADVATLGRERDFAAGMVKLRADRLENARDARRSVWRLVEWARGADLAKRQQPVVDVQNGLPENVPADRWP
jgi:hypothetical protein